MVSSSSSSNNPNFPHGFWNRAAQVASAIGGIGGATNARSSLQRQRQGDFALKVESQKAIVKNQMTAPQYLEASALANEGVGDATRFLKDQNLIGTDQVVRDFYEGPFGAQFPCSIPMITQNRRKVITTNNTTGKSSTGDGPPASMHDNATGNFPGSSQPIVPSSAEKTTTFSRKEDASMLCIETSILEQKNQNNDFYTAIEQQYLQPDLKALRCSSGFASASSSIANNSQNNGQTIRGVEVFSVPKPNSRFDDYAIYLVCFSLSYMVVSPILEKGSAYVRGLLNSFFSKKKKAPNNPNMPVTPSMAASPQLCFARMDDLSDIRLSKIPLMNPMEIVAKCNKDELTFSQGKLLLEKFAGLSKEEIEILLKKD